MYTVNKKKQISLYIHIGSNCQVFSADNAKNHIVPYCLLPKNFCLIFSMIRITYQFKKNNRYGLL